MPKTSAVNQDGELRAGLAAWGVETKKKSDASTDTPNVVEEGDELVVPSDNCSNLLFRDLCLKLAEIEAKGTAWSGTDKFKCIFNHELAEDLKGQSMYPLVRLLLPFSDCHLVSLSQSLGLGLRLGFRVMAFSLYCWHLI